MKRLVYILSPIMLLTLFSFQLHAQILVRCYAHVEDYITHEPVQGQSIKLQVVYSVMLEPEAFPTEVEHYFYGTTNASGDCYIWAYIPVEDEWYDDPFPPEIMWMRAFYEGSYSLESSEGTYSSSSSTLYPNFYVYYSDLDEDGITETIETAIAEQFKPVLIKSDNVANYPELQQDLGNFRANFSLCRRIRDELSYGIVILP